MTEHLEKSLRVYRLAVIALLVVVAVMAAALVRERVDTSGPPAGDTAPPGANAPLVGLRLIDLGQRAAALSAKVADVSDLSEHYLTTRGGSVHMHLLGAGQRIPLHIHRRTHELTAVLTGRPQVSQVHGTRDGAVATHESTHRPGELIYSPPFAGHAWYNPAEGRSQANLVFATPRFDGNFFVTADDPRLARPTSPRSFDAATMLKSLGDRDFLLEPLPVMPAAMSQLLVRSRAELRGVHVPSAILVLRGAATIHSNEALRVRARHLLLVPANRRLRVDASEPTAMLIFRPDAL